MQCGVIQAGVRSVWVPVWCHIPDRFKGLWAKLGGTEGLKAQGAELILTVDCGITAHAPLAAY